MAIPEYVRDNFQTLMRAAADDRVALMECTDKETGGLEYVVCAVNEVGEEIEMTPFSKMFQCNPYDVLLPTEG